MADVPNVPGVPSLPSYSSGSQPEPATSDSVDNFPGASNPAWGLYLNGVPVISADTIVTFDYRAEWTVSDYPIEQGSFESYDKVTVPFDVRIRYVTGGSEAARQSFLKTIDAAAQTLSLYDVYTPEATYTSVNITHYDYRRTATNGVGLLGVDVWCIQVRVTAQSQFTNTQAPSGANSQPGGNVQPQTPSQYIDSGFTAMGGVQ